MKLIYTKSFDKCLKKLKKYPFEMKSLNIILKVLFESINSFNDIYDSSLNVFYNFEKLKYDLSEYYSFNLGKNGGVIRLIVKPKDGVIELCFISFNHYRDFNKGKVIENE